MNKVWQWLNGKKTVVAEFYWSGLAAINLIWFPQGLPDTYNKVYLTIGILLTALGLGHKGFKKVIAVK